MRVVISKNGMSLMVVLLFACLSLASTSKTEVSVIDKETGEVRVANELKANDFVTEWKEGIPNDTGRWNGEVTETQPTTNKEPTYIVAEIVGLFPSRHGMTRYYDKDKNLLYMEHYTDGKLNWSTKPKGASSAREPSARGEAAGAFTKTFRMLENTRPWYVTKVDKFGFTRDQLNAFTGQLEPLIAAQRPSNTAEFTDAFYDAMGELFKRAEYALFKDVYQFLRDVEGMENAKNFEVRLAEMGRYRGQGDSTYAVLTASYAAFVQKMAQMGVDAAALKKFTDDLDARMIAKGPLDIADTLFPFTVDSRMQEVLQEMSQSEHQAMFTALGVILTDYYNQGEPLLLAARDAYFKNLPTAVYMLLLFGD